MSNNRYIKLKNIGISQERYNELSAFCMQYREWKDGQKREYSAVRGKKIFLIEDIAKRSSEYSVGDPGLSEYIIKNVAEGRPCYYLKSVLRMPFNDKAFYCARTRFFILLNEEKE